MSSFLGTALLLCYFKSAKQSAVHLAFCFEPFNEAVIIACVLLQIPVIHNNHPKLLTWLIITGVAICPPSHCCLSSYLQCLAGIMHPHTLCICGSMPRCCYLLKCRDKIASVSPML